MEWIKLPSGEIRLSGALAAYEGKPSVASISGDIQKRIDAAKTRDDINKLYKEIDAWYRPARVVAKAVSSSAVKELDSAQANLMLALQTREQALGFVPKLPPTKTEIPWGTLALVGVGLVLVLTMTKRGE